MSSPCDRTQRGSAAAGQSCPDYSRKASRGKPPVDSRLCPDLRCGAHGSRLQRGSIGSPQPLRSAARRRGSGVGNELMHLREARAEDAVEACQVLRRSIAELCIADHRNEAAILEQWLANKTPENVASWISHPNNHVFIAADNEGTIVAVGAVTSAGEITLLYVS